MKTINFWYLLVLLLAGMLINENVVQWMLAVTVGNYSISAGFADAFEYFSISGYLFFTAFRMIPYFNLGVLVVVLSRTKWKDYVFPVFGGGLAGILATIIYYSWHALRPYYTDQHVSSTTAIAFLVIPFLAFVGGAIGALAGAALYTPFRILTKKRKSPNPPPLP